MHVIFQSKILPILRTCRTYQRTISRATPLSGKDDKFLRTYNIPHPPKDPPEDYQPECVNHDAFEEPDFLPASVYRQFESPSEVLGPGADKCALQYFTLQVREEQRGGISEGDADKGTDCGNSSPAPAPGGNSKNDDKKK